MIGYYHVSSQSYVMLKKAVVLKGLKEKISEKIYHAVLQMIYSLDVPGVFIKLLFHDAACLLSRLLVMVRMNNLV